MGLSLYFQRTKSLIKRESQGDFGAKGIVEDTRVQSLPCKDFCYHPKKGKYSVLFDFMVMDVRTWNDHYYDITIVILILEFVSWNRKSRLYVYCIMI